MPSRRHLLLALSAAGLVPHTAFGQAPDPVSGDIPDARIAAGADLHDRLTIPVMVGQAGPFDFVVDTGADRSVLAQDIAEQLALPPGRDVLIQGVTGAEMAPTVAAPPLNLGQVTLSGLDLPVLPRERLGVDGLLGVDALQKRRLVMDFRARRLEILQAGGPRPPGPRRREAFVPARDRYGRLVVIDANANEADIGVFVDSGSGLTIANRALARAIRFGGDWREPAPTFPIRGVTSHEVHGEVRVLDSLRLGGLRFTDVPMLVADLDLFDRWGLGDRPTLLLGINVLRLFSRVEMDYSRRRLMFRVGVDPQIWLA